MATGDTSMLAQAGDNTPLKPTFHRVAALVDTRGDRPADDVFKECAEVVFSIIGIVISQREAEREEERRGCLTDARQAALRN